MGSYEVLNRDGCKLIFGNVPLSDFTGLTEGMPKAAVLDTHAARVLGATFAFGLPADLEALVSQPDVVANAMARAETLMPRGSDSAKRWLALGRQGASSKTLFGRLLGVDLTGGRDDHPHDGGDFQRCRDLLREVPELQARLSEMAAVSLAWALVVQEWAALCALMDSGESGKANRRLRNLELFAHIESWDGERKKGLLKSIAESGDEPWASKAATALATEIKAEEGGGPGEAEAQQDQQRQGPQQGPVQP